MRLADALLALDRAVTSAGEARALETQRRQSWIAAAESALERFARGQEFYCLSDGGNSAVAYSPEYRWCALTPDSSVALRESFEDALNERRVIEQLVADWLDRRRAQTPRF